MQQFAQNFKLKLRINALFLVLVLVTLELSSSCAIPLSDPFEIVFTERDHITNQKPDDVRFTGKSDLEVRSDFKKHELNRLIYRRRPDRDFEDLKNIEPFVAGGRPGDVWQNPFGSTQIATQQAKSEETPTTPSAAEAAPAANATAPSQEEAVESDETENEESDEEDSADEE